MRKEVIFLTELQLKEVVRNDPLYLELLSACNALEEDFLRIRAGLSAEDRELLDKYISLCEEMDHRRTMLALR